MAEKVNLFSLMAIYTYKAKIKPDMFKTGTIEAESEKAAVNKLLQINYHPISIKLKQEKRLKKIKLFQQIGHKEIYIFLRQLSNLIQAGLPLVKALANISIQTSNPNLKIVVFALKEKIQKGKMFSEALANYPHIFSALEINMVKSAETSGTLPEVITKIADLKERAIAFTYKIKSALAYPILLLTVGILTLFVLTTFVLPKFISLFQDLNQQLPLLTQLLITFSLFMEKFWMHILFLLIIFSFSLSNYFKTAAGKLWFDELQLKIPFLRDIIVKVQTGRFARTLASLLENGIPILLALQIISDILDNKVFAREIKNVHLAVSKGQHISIALKDSRLFEKNTLDLISVGEESGRLEEMLFRIAEMNETESSQQIESFVFMLEPALILILGGIVALIVMAILLPIFQMNFLIQ